MLLRVAVESNLCCKLMFLLFYIILKLFSCIIPDSLLLLIATLNLHNILFKTLTLVLLVPQIGLQTVILLNLPL
jgi:hypothetical protein